VDMKKLYIEEIIDVKKQWMRRNYGRCML